MSFYEMPVPLVFTENSIVDKHDENRPYKCDVCGKCYNSKIYLKDHLTIHSEVRSYQCNICSKRFRFGSNLSEHKTVHIVDNLFFKCTECNHAVRLRGNLKKHMKTHFKDSYALEEVWRKLRDSGALDVNRNLRQENCGRRRASLNANCLSLDGIDFKPPPMLSNSFTFGKSEVRPPTLMKLSGGSGDAFNTMQLASIASIQRPKDSLSSDVPPALISVTEAQRLAQMKKNGEDITEAKIVDFEKVVEESANIAKTIESFYARLDNIPFEETVCPFCTTKFSSLGECEEHIFVSHDKPQDSIGNTLFCDVCLKLFDNMESKNAHQQYHNLIDEMLKNKQIEYETGLTEFKNSQAEKFVTAY